MLGGEIGLFTPWPQEGARTSSRTEIPRNWRTGLGRVRGALYTDGPQSVNRGAQQKKQHDSVEVKLIFPEEKKKGKVRRWIKRGWEDGVLITQKLVWAGKCSQVLVDAF